MKILAVIVAVVCLAGQASGTPVAGTWRAQFDGRTFVTLELESANGTVTGLISLGDIEVASKVHSPESASQSENRPPSSMYCRQARRCDSP